MKTVLRVVSVIGTAIVKVLGPGHQETRGQKLVNRGRGVVRRVLVQDLHQYSCQRRGGLRTKVCRVRDRGKRSDVRVVRKVGRSWMLGN